MKSVVICQLVVVSVPTYQTTIRCKSVDKVKALKLTLHCICNHFIPNIVDLSDVLFKLRIQFEYTQTQCDEGAIDGIDIWYMGIIYYYRG